MDKQIRIVQVIGGMNLGGAENFLMNIYRNIDRDKIQFDFLVNRKGVFDDEIKKLGGKIFYIPALQKVGPIIYKIKLTRFFKEHPEYKIVHSHLSQVNGIILETANKCEVPNRIAHSHNTSNLTNNFLARIYKNYLNSKINKNATQLFACSKLAAEWLYKEKASEAIIINNAIDIERFKYNNEKRIKIRKELNIADNEIVMGHVGRFSEQKNHKFLIEIFNEYQKTDQTSKLLLVGDGPLRSNIENQIKELDLENKVILIGNQKNVEDYYSAMDVFVFPSLFEGLGMVLIEAQINGLRCITSNTVPLVANITGNVKYLPLTNKMKWGEELNNTYFNRYNCLELIMKSNYNIVTETKKVENMYLEFERMV